MPAKSKKQGLKWRVVDERSTKIITDAGGNPQDKGGFIEKSEADKKVRSLNKGRGFQQRLRGM